MTPHQFARAECANFDQTNGACKGIGIKDDGSLFSFGAKPQCVLVDRQPCPYFEECVLPMNIEPCNAVNKVRAGHLAEAKHIYAQFSPNYRKTKPRKCRACNRRPVTGGKRYCPECAEARRRASSKVSAREAMRRSRQEGSHVSKNDSPMP